MTKLLLDFTIDFYDDWDVYEEFIRSLDPKLERMKRVFLDMEFKDQERKKIFNSYGFKYSSGAWKGKELDDITTKRIIDMAEDLKNAHIGYLCGGMIVEELTNEEEEATDWFFVYTRYTDAFEFKEDYPVCKAFQCPPNIHIVDHDHVSERFKEVVEGNKLKGLDFLWFKDIGKYRAPQWYWAIPQKPLGHGIDHEWFDREKYKQHALDPDSPIDNVMKKLMSKSLQLEYIKGETHFNCRYFKSNWTTNSKLLDKLLSMFPLDDKFGLRFYSSPRFQRKCLPDTDFAYIWDQPGTSFCINRKAKEILQENYLLHDVELKGILLYDEVPEGNENLDIIKEFPLKVYLGKEKMTPEFMSQLKQKESKYFKEFQNIEKPVRKPNIKRSLQILKKSKKHRPEDFKRGLSNRKLGEAVHHLSFKLPRYWLDALKISNGGWFRINKENYTCEITPIEDLNQYHNEIYKDRKMSDVDYNEQYIYFGGSDCGDFFAFKKEKQSEVPDCPIHLISHEDYSLRREWEGIADFLESILLE